MPSRGLPSEAKDTRTHLQSDKATPANSSRCELCRGSVTVRGRLRLRDHRGTSLAEFATPTVSVPNCASRVTEVHARCESLPDINWRWQVQARRRTRLPATKRAQQADSCAAR